MVRRTTLLLLTIAFFVAAFPAFAQESGQFCVKAFDDRNGNGAQDANEPPITRGIGANLLDEEGVVVESAIIDGAPTANEGVICFINLSPGQYTMVITSAEYTSTTGDNMTVNVVSNEQALLEFGGEHITASASTSSSSQSSTSDDYDRDRLVKRALISGAGAGGAMLVSALIGYMIYLVTLRRRYKRVPQMIVPSDVYYRRPSPTSTTGTMRAVRPPTDTGEYPRRK